MAQETNWNRGGPILLQVAKALTTRPKGGATWPEINGSRVSDRGEYAESIIGMFSITTVSVAVAWSGLVDERRKIL